MTLLRYLSVVGIIFLYSKTYSQSSLRPQLALAYLKLAKNAQTASIANTPSFLTYNPKNRFINPANSLHSSKGFVNELDINFSPLGVFWNSTQPGYFFTFSFSKSIDNKHAIFLGNDYLQHSSLALINENFDYLGENKSYDLNLTFGYTYRISPNVTIGTNLIYLNSRLTSLAEVNSQLSDIKAINMVIFDFGVNYFKRIHKDVKINLGISFLNLGGKLHYTSNSSFLPSRTNLSYSVIYKQSNSNQFTFTLQTTKSLVSQQQTTYNIQDDNISVPVNTSIFETWKNSFKDYTSLNSYLRSSTNTLSVEYLYKYLLRFALGISYKKNNLHNTFVYTSGIGINLQNLSINLSYESASLNQSSSIYPNDKTINIGFKYTWAKNKKNKILLCPNGF